MAGVDVDAVTVAVEAGEAEGEVVITASIQTPDKASAEKARATLVETLGTAQSATAFLATSSGLDMTATEIDTTAVSLTVVDKEEEEEDGVSAVGGIIGDSVGGVVALALLAAVGLKLLKGGGDATATKKAQEGVDLTGNSKI